MYYDQYYYYLTNTIIISAQTPLKNKVAEDGMICYRIVWYHYSYFSSSYFNVNSTVTYSVFHWLQVISVIQYNIVMNKTDLKYPYQYLQLNKTLDFCKTYVYFNLHFLSFFNKFLSLFHNSIGFFHTDS